MLDVQTGNIEVLLNKPISYLLYRSWWQIGAGAYSFLVSLILGVALLWIIIGIPATMTTVLFWSTLLAVIFGTLLLGIILYLIVGILAFWIEDINPVFWVVDKAVMILGGSYLPLALFPAFMQKVALYSPFGAVQFITHTVYVSWSSQWWIALAMQAFWIITLGIVLHVLFIAAREKVSVNGG
jgi:ABC-2 type transport system permease protein